MDYDRFVCWLLVAAAVAVTVVVYGCDCIFFFQSSPFGYVALVVGSQMIYFAISVIFLLISAVYAANKSNLGFPKAKIIIFFFFPNTKK